MSIDSTDEHVITGISSMATRKLLHDIVDEYQQMFGQRVVFESVGGVTASERVRDGEIFDVVVLAAPAIGRLVTDGRVDASSVVGIADSGIAIAVRTGAPRPSIANEAAVREAMLSAHAVGYSTGPSGAHLMQLLARWGLSDNNAPRLVQAPAGVPVGSLVAQGEVDLGFQQLSELMDFPGVDIIGPLPSDIQSITTFSAALCTASTHQDAAKRFLDFLGSPSVAAMTSRHGMQAPSA